MLDITDDLLRKLAFQRGVLSLVKTSEWDRAVVDKAIEELDLMIENFSQQIP